MASFVVTRRLALIGASAAVLAACAKKGGGGERPDPRLRPRFPTT